MNKNSTQFFFRPLTAVFFLSVLLFVTGSIKAQTYNYLPITGTGYNKDVIADGNRYAYDNGSANTPRYVMSGDNSSLKKYETMIDTTAGDTYFGVVLFDSTYKRNASNAYLSSNPLPNTNQTIG